MLHASAYTIVPLVITWLSKRGLDKGCCPSLPRFLATAALPLGDKKKIKKEDAGQEGIAKEKHYFTPNACWLMSNSSSQRSMSRAMLWSRLIRCCNALHISPVHRQDLLVPNLLMRAHMSDIAMYCRTNPVRGTRGIVK